MAELVLTLNTTGPGALDPATRRMEGDRLTIGRGADSDWVLDDPGRDLSRQHCVIERRGDRFWVTDTSTNGVFVNDAAQALGHGGTHPLTDGDRLRLGSHVLTVRFEGARSAAGAPSRGDDRGGFGADVPRVRADEPSSSPSHSLFDTSFPGAGPREAGPPPPPKPSDGGGSHGGLFDTAFSGAAERDEASPPRSPPPPQGGRGGPQAGNLFDGDWPLSGGPDDDGGDLWRDEPAATREPSGPATPPDHGGIQHDHFELPRPAAEPPRAFDWSDLPAEPEAPRTAPPPPPPPLRPEPPGQPEPPRPAVERPTEPEWLPAAEPREPPRAAVPPPPPARPAEPPRPAPPPSPAAGADASALLAALLLGAGLDPAAVADRDPEALMRAVGESFREMAEGLRTVLIARAMVKREALLGQTVIAARDNNPLKFAADADEALLALLAPRGPGYLPPVEAVRAGFRDIKAHELAVMAGVRAALDAVLERFDPRELEKRLANRSAVARFVPGGRKAKTWDTFVEEYRAIARDAERSFRGTFGEAFAEAYERQMRNL